MIRPSQVQEHDDLCTRIAALVEEVIADSAVFLVEVKVRGAKGSRVVEAFVDSDEAFGADELTHISREVGFLLDMEDIVAGRYTLNVSTPGLDRPLALLRQYRKNVGRDVRVRYVVEDDPGDAEVTGRLLAAADDTIEVAVSGSDVRRIRLDDVVRAHVQLPW